MSKLTLNNVGNLIDATTAATTINDNSAAIVAAMENTLSRDGTTPNQMGSDLDMNSHDILNVKEIQLRDGTTLTQLPTSTSEGSMIIRGEKEWEVLLPGNDTQFLQTHGPSAKPTWEYLPGGGDMLRSDYDKNNISLDIFGNGLNVKLLTDIPTISTPAAVNYIKTSGFSQAGIGGAIYKKVDSEPSHEGKIQDFLGNWFEIAETILTPYMFGAFDNGTDCLTSLQKLFKTADILKLPINLLGSTWIISDSLTYTFTSKPKIYGQKATIKLDRGANPSVQYGVALTVGVYGADCRGWSVDGNQQCSIPLAWIGATSMATVGDLYSEDNGALNSLRDDTTRVGAYGLWVYGGFGLVNLVRPSVKSVKVASGMIVPSIKGAAGLVIEPSTSAYSRWVDIQDPYISDVYSLDTTVNNDQDGISIFGLAPLSDFRRDEYVRIKGGQCRNCRGRGIKIARQNTKIEGTYFYRNGSDGYAGRGLMEIDFQFGEGVVKDISYFHTGGVTVEKIVSSSYQANMISTDFVVDGVRGYVDTAMTPYIDYLIVSSFSSGTNQPIKTVIRNVDQRGRGCLYVAQIATNLSSSGEHWTIEDTRAVAGSGLFKVSSGNVYVTANRNITLAGGTVPIADETGGTAFWTGSDNQGYAPRQFSLGVSGLTTSPTITVNASRTGDVVVLTVPSLSGTSNTSSMSIGNLPANLRPSADRPVLFRVTDNNVALVGVAVIHSTGQIDLYSSVSLGSWTSSGVKGFASQTFTYSI